MKKRAFQRQPAGAKRHGGGARRQRQRRGHSIQLFGHKVLGSPAALPPTLIVHHRHDECHETLPDGVAPFLAWAGGRARVVWLDGGVSEGNLCDAMAHHGFNGLDGQVVGVVSGFAAR